LAADLADGIGPDFGAAVGQFVAVDGGNDDVFEAHEGGGLSDASRLIGVEEGGLAGLDVAEAAGAGADIAEDHEGGGSACPAFAEVGALGGLADGVEVVLVDEGAGFVVAGAVGELGAEPVGFLALDEVGSAVVEDLIAKAESLHVLYQWDLICAFGPRQFRT